MKNRIGELQLGKALLVVVIACMIAWLVYSRFSFRKEVTLADRTVILERELHQTKDAYELLRKRVDEIERRLPAPAPPAVRKTKLHQKLSKGK